MFCKKCGEEIQEEWIVCPQCGETLKNAENEELVQKNNVEGAQYRRKNRSEIKEELLGKAFQENGSVVLLYGTNGISKDLVRVLEPGEEIFRFYSAFRNSIWGRIKSSSMFRNYMVCTNRRLIYIEGIRPIAFNILVFLRTAICIPYKEIVQVTANKRTGLYSGKITVESKGKKMNYAVLSHKDAIELEGFLNDMKKDSIVE